MSANPLFPSDSQSPDAKDWRTSTPIPPQVTAPVSPGANPAADLIRQKLANIYAEEPNSRIEQKEAIAARPRSKHQQFMYELSTSGKSLAEIQTEWHSYYAGLPDSEKHQVWQEFYETTAKVTGRQIETPTPKPTVQENKVEADGSGINVGQFQPKELPTNRRMRAIDRRTSTEIKKAIRNKISAGGKLKARHHIQSLVFGLGMGSLVIFIFLFGFFNQVIIAPFIQPGRNTSDTPIILDPNGAAPSPNPEVIIPKIDVEIPVIYSQTSINEADIENSLQDGVVHYPTTVMPGQIGNAAFFGHSSNNVFVSGQYKYAFVLLHEMVDGDTFYLTFNSKIYIYQVISRTIVSPSDVGVLNSVPGQTATATLITCDPPGTSLNRLVVVGQQISPDPNTDSQPAIETAAAETATTNLPGDGPSLYSQITNSLIGKLIMAAVLIAGIVILVWSIRLVILNI